MQKRQGLWVRIFPPQDVAAKLLLQTRSGKSKVVKLLAQNATSVELTEAAQTLTVYPSITVDKLHVSASYLEYLIFNNSGQLQQKGKYAETIDVSRLPAGNYFIQLLVSETEVQTRRFIRK